MIHAIHNWPTWLTIQRTFDSHDLSCNTQLTHRPTRHHTIDPRDSPCITQLTHVTHHASHNWPTWLTIQRTVDSHDLPCNTQLTHMTHMQHTIDSDDPHATHNWPTDPPGITQLTHMTHHASHNWPTWLTMHHTVDPRDSPYNAQLTHMTHQSLKTTYH